MMKFSLFFVGCWLFMLNSCGNKKEVLVLDHIKESTLQLKKEVFNDPSLLPKGCCIKDSFLIVFNPKDKDGFLYIYNKNSKDLLKKYGKIGEGPDDFKNPHFLFNENLHSSSNTLLVGDVMYLYTVNIDSVLKNVRVAHTIQSEIPDNLRLYNYVLQDNDSMLIVNQTRDFQLTFYNRKTQKTDLKNYFEKLSGLKNASNFCYVMQIYDAYYSSNKEKIVIAYKNRKQIDIISMSGKLLKRIYFPSYDYNRNMMFLNGNVLQLEEEAYRFFSFVYSTKNSFYALCWDDTMTNIKQGTAKSTLYKFSWEGDLEEIIHFDKAVSYFCIDQNVLYAIGLSEKDLDLNIYSATIK